MNKIQKIRKIRESAKDATNQAVFAYVAIITAKGASKLAKEFWTWKTQNAVSPK